MHGLQELLRPEDDTRASIVQTPNQVLASVNRMDGFSQRGRPRRICAVRSRGRLAAVTVVAAPNATNHCCYVCVVLAGGTDCIINQNTLKVPVDLVRRSWRTKILVFFTTPIIFDK